VVECLPSKGKVWSSNPSNNKTIKKIKWGKWTLLKILQLELSPRIIPKRTTVAKAKRKFSRSRTKVSTYLWWWREYQKRSRSALGLIPANLTSKRKVATAILSKTISQCFSFSRITLAMNPHHSTQSNKLHRKGAEKEKSSGRIPQTLPNGDRLKHLGLGI
jgi:hypothetical protein